MTALVASRRRAPRARRTLSILLAIVLVMSAGLLTAAGARSAAGSGQGTGSTLTRHFPLGGRRVCCARSVPSPAPAAGSPTTTAPRPPPRPSARPPRRVTTTTGRDPTMVLAAEVVVAVSLAVLAICGLHALRNRRRLASPPALGRVLPRPRRPVSPRLLVLLSPLIRYSAARGAYVLRVIGDRLGPVLIKRSPSR